MNRREFSEVLVLGLGAMAVRPLSAATPLMGQIGDRNKMGKIRINVVPTSVPDWDKEDEASAVLGGEELIKADDTQTKAMLEEITLELPAALYWAELARYAQQHHTLGGLLISPDSKRFSYYVIETPLTIILPDNQRLVRLRLMLDLHAEHGKPEDALAYDVFPPTEVDINKLATGEVNLDISKALQFVLTSVGAARVAPVADSLGFKLNLTFQWTTTSVKLQSSGKMSSRVQWYVSDDSIQKGFAAAAILRAPKGTTVTVDATMAGELRFRGPRGWFKSQFASPQSHKYVLS